MKRAEGGIRFLDSAFQPVQDSLFNMNDTYLATNSIPMWKTLGWTRASEFQDSPRPSLYSTVDPLDIQPSELLNDAYFVSALTALALHPERVKSLFLPGTDPAQGKIAIQGYFAGRRVQITMDDFLPRDTKANQPAFVRTNSRSLWPMFAEKAWAKLNGSYENIGSGNVTEALKFLAGSPSANLLSHSASSLDTLWRSITEALDKRHLVCATNDKSAEDFSPLVPGNAAAANYSYPILQAREITIRKGKYRLLLVLDPWETRKWDGEWSAASLAWTEETKRTLGYTSLIGTRRFYIKLEDYVNFFYGTAVCHVFDKHVFTEREAGHKLGDYTLMKMIVDERPATGWITVAQVPRRSMAAKYTNYEVSEANFMLGRLGEGKVTFVHGETGKSESLCVQIGEPLEEGQYLIFVEISWCIEGVNTFVLNTYTSGRVSLISLDKSDYPTFLQDILKSCAVQRSKQKSYEALGEREIVKYVSINDSKAGYGYVYYQNQSKTTELHESLNFKELRGLKLAAPQGKSKKVHVDLPPQRDFIVVLKKTAPGAAFSTDKITKLKFSKERLLDILAAKGKVTKMKEAEIYFTSLAHDFGYVWSCHNRSSNTLFGGKFKFNLNNLQMAELEREFEVELEPGKQVVKFLRTVDPDQSASYKYEYTPFLKDMKFDAKRVVEEILQVAAPKQIKYMDSLVPVHYYTYYKNGNYYWYFVNGTEKQFKARLTFTPNNLELVEPAEEDPNSWEVVLEPNEDCLRYMSVVDYKRAVSYQVIIKVMLTE